MPRSERASRVEADAVGVAHFDDPMVRETQRLDTFRHWPKGDMIRPERLAQAGLYYTGQSDRVQCAFCHGILYDWAPGEIPLDEHRRIYPECPFVGNNRTANVPASRDLSPLRGREGVPEAPACHPGMARSEARLATFNRWPPQLEQRPTPLVEAGFYSTGTGDNVTCFFCGVSLGNWQRSELPWYEHARWSPNCEYVQYVKGVQYVHSTLEECRAKGHRFASVEPIPARNPAPNPRPAPVRINPLQERGHDVSPQDEIPGFAIGGTAVPPEPARPASLGSTTQELLLLREDRLCKICLDRERDTVLLPCRHFAICRVCATRCDVCPICMQNITSKIQTYYS